MTKRVGLDFETYSATDLTTHGLARYVQDPTFRPLLAAVAEPGMKPQCFDFVLGNFELARKTLRDYIFSANVVAHNAGFEYAVLEWLGLADAPHGYIDSAMVARANGGSGSLAMASRQFLPQSKMEEGRDLIKLFSIPGKYQEETGSLEFDPRVVEDHRAMWDVFTKYCKVDAELGLNLTQTLTIPVLEEARPAVTFRMNQVGWPVDRDTVEEMYARYLENQLEALNDFAVTHGAADLNVNSHQQLKKWCAERGIKAVSFDEKHVAKLITTISNKLSTGVNAGTQQNYTEVLDLLNLKQVLGGSSLKKLKVILDTSAKDEHGTWRLKDQYIHCGAPQTLRTTGRSVQMQNLKRFEGAPADMSTLHDPDVSWTNDEMAVNLRQVFTSSHPYGQLIVGDFASVESRGLAYLANESWKLKAFTSGRDLYKVQAAAIYSVLYDQVSDAQRQTGKVGELSCGYQAGPAAVQGFAEKMGVTMNEAEAARLVIDWRAVNPAIVQLWQSLDDCLHEALSTRTSVLQLAMGGQIRMHMEPSPHSLQQIYPQAMTLVVTLALPSGEHYMSRRFHGAHVARNNVRFFKPSKKKTGDIWVNSYIDPKTKQRRFHELYGGKLAGILTQSFCREMFFDQLVRVDAWVRSLDTVSLIGQFHDEIVLDWVPGGPPLDLVKAGLKTFMSNNHQWPGFPMAAEVKSDYRYTK